MPSQPSDHSEHDGITLADQALSSLLPPDACMAHPAAAHCGERWRGFECNREPDHSPPCIAYVGPDDPVAVWRSPDATQAAPQGD